MPPTTRMLSYLRLVLILTDIAPALALWNWRANYVLQNEPQAKEDKQPSEYRLGPIESCLGVVTSDVTREVVYRSSHDYIYRIAKRN